MTAKKFTMLLNEKLTLIKSNGYKIIRGYKFIKIENKNEDEEGFINDDSDDDGGFMPKEKNNIKSNNNNNKVDINNDVYENNTFNKSFLDDGVDD